MLLHPLPRAGRPAEEVGRTPSAAQVGAEVLGREETVRETVGMSMRKGARKPLDAGSSVPEESGGQSHKIVLRPPTAFKVLALFLAGGGLWCASVLVGNWSEFTVFGHWWVGLGAIFMLGVAIDGLQRRYVIGRTSIAIRVLFLWKTYDVPADVEVSSDDRRFVVLRDPRRRRPIIRIPSFYNRKGVLTDSIQRLRGVSKDVTDAF